MAHSQAGIALSQSLLTEELLVTSPPLELNSLDLSSALSTLDSAELNRANITHSSELASLAPALTVLQSFNNRQSALLIRGLGTLIFSAGIEPSVITMVDGVSQGRAAQGMLSLLDVKRVEIWRGPQITRFGRGAAAGAVNLLSERAGEQWQGRVQLLADSATAYDSERTLVNAFVGGPLSDELGVRFGLLNSEQDGFVSNVFDGRKLNNERRQAYVSKFDLSLAESFSLALDAGYSETEARCCAPTVRSVNDLQYANLLLPVVAASGNTQSNTNTAFVSDSRASHVHLRADKQWASGWHLNSLSAYSRYAERESQDFDFLPVDFIPLSAGYDSHEQFSQHLRLESSADAGLQYFAGAYYERQSRQREYARGLLGLFDAQFQARLRQSSTAVFAGLQAEASRKLQIELGLRYSEDRVRFTADRDAFALQGLSQLDGVSDSHRAQALDAEASLLYQMNELSSWYLRWARGHKAPAYNLLFDLDADALAPVSKEVGTSWELAYRRYLPKQQLWFSATAFHTRFDDYQAQVQEPGSVKFMLINSGDISSYGLELEARWRYRRLTLRSALDWTVAEIGKVQGVPCGNGEVLRGECPAGFRDLDGEALPFAPTLKTNIQARYDFPVSLFGLKLSANTRYRWQSTMETAFNNDPYREQGAFGLWSLGLSAEGEQLSLRVFADNVLDKRFALAHFDNPVDAGGYVSFFARESARRVGFSLSYSF